MERSVVKVSVFLTLGIFISSKFSLKTIYCFILIISSLIMLLFFKKAILKKILICFIYFNIGIILLNIKNKEDIFFDYNKKNVKINFDVVDIGLLKCPCQEIPDPRTEMTRLIASSPTIAEE